MELPKVMTLNEISESAHSNAKAKGFYDSPPTTL